MVGNLVQNIDKIKDLKIGVDNLNENLFYKQMKFLILKIYNINLDQGQLIKNSK